jgi:hypothetical protein
LTTGLISLQWRSIAPSHVVIPYPLLQLLQLLGRFQLEARMTTRRERLVRTECDVNLLAGISDIEPAIIRKTAQRMHN